LLLASALRPAITRTILRRCGLEGRDGEQGGGKKDGHPFHGDGFNLRALNDG